MFNVKMIQEALRPIIKDTILSDLESNGAILPEGCEDADAVIEKIFADPQTSCQLVANMSYLLGQVGKVWGIHPWLIFNHMGWNDDQQTKALEYLFFQLFGHGIGLDDYCHSQGLRGLCKAEGVLHKLFPISRMPTADQYEMLGSEISVFLDWQEDD